MSVTHDQDEALELFDGVALLDNGRLEQVGTLDEVQETPASPTVLRSLDDKLQVNAVFDQSRVQVNCRTVAVQATSGTVGSIKLYVHPWQLHFADCEVAHLQGLVCSSYQTQGRQRIELDKSGGKTLIVEDKAEKRLQPGELVHLRITNGYIFKN